MSNRKNVKKRLKSLAEKSGIYADAYNDLAEDFYSIPAADVAPVVHGRWVDAGRGIKACSNCNHGIKEHMACANH